MGGWVGEMEDGERRRWRLAPSRLPRRLLCDEMPALCCFIILFFFFFFFYTLLSPPPLTLAQLHCLLPCRLRLEAARVLEHVEEVLPRAAGLEEGHTHTHNARRSAVC